MDDFDLLAIRDRLNQETFEGGKRRVSIGRVTELFADLDKRTVSAQLDTLAADLHEQDLALIRGDEDADELFVEQSLKYAAVDTSWMRDAIQWVSKITTVALEMVVPAAIGMWADQRLGTSFLAMLGLVIGVPLGIWHLLRLTSTKRGE